jgi:mono/diheme cytochrome c family protein
VAAALRDPAALERGRRVFIGTCTGYCHAVEGAGSSEAPDLFDCDWLHGGSDAEVFRTITGGVPGTQMAPFAGLLDERDVWRVIAYLRSESSCSAPR